MNHTEQKAAEYAESLTKKLLEKTKSHPSLPGIDIITDLAVLLAYSDKTIDANEKSALLRVISSLSRGFLTETQRTQELESSLLSIQESNPQESLKRLAESLSLLDAVEIGLQLGIAISLASSGISLEERKTLEGLASASGVSSYQLEQLIQSVQSHIDTH